MEAQAPILLVREVVLSVRCENLCDINFNLYLRHDLDLLVQTMFTVHYCKVEDLWKVSIGEVEIHYFGTPCSIVWYLNLSCHNGLVSLCITQDLTIVSNLIPLLVFVETKCYLSFLLILLVGCYELSSNDGLSLPLRR